MTVSSLPAAQNHPAETLSQQLDTIGHRVAAAWWVATGVELHPGTVTLDRHRVVVALYERWMAGQEPEALSPAARRRLDRLFARRARQLEVMLAAATDDLLGRTLTGVSVHAGTGRGHVVVELRIPPTGD